MIFEWSPYLLMFCRVFVLVVFLYSFVSKARNMESFQKSVANFKILPDQFVKLTTSLLITSELIVVLLLAWRELLPLGFALATLLLFVYTTAIMWVLNRNVATSCNCFGANDQLVSRYDIVRNIGFILSATVGFMLFQLAEPVYVELGFVEILLMSVASIIFAIIWIHIGDISQVL